MPKKITGGIEYECSKEAIEKYKAMPAKWKLDWLEEANRLTFNVLSEKEKKVRNKIRKGLV